MTPVYLQRSGRDKTLIFNYRKGLTYFWWACFVPCFLHAAISHFTPRSSEYVTFQQQVRVIFLLPEVVTTGESRLVHSDFVSAGNNLSVRHYISSDSIRLLVIGSKLMSVSLRYFFFSLFFFFLDSDWAPASLNICVRAFGFLWLLSMYSNTLWKCL